MARAARQLNLSGVFAAAVTATQPGTLDADYTSALDLLDFLAAKGADGICLLGSTGEFLNFSFSDRQRLVYLANKRTRVPLIVGVSHSTLTGALQAADDAISSGADALLLMPPYFFPYGQAEIEEFYRQFAREADDAVPLLLYNIPQFTSGIAIETAQRLLDGGLYAGIKDSSGDWAYFEKLLELKRASNFALLAGNDRIAARALASGADGLVSGCACAIPETVVALTKAIRSGDNAKAEALDRSLQEFIGWIERFPTPIGIKTAVALRKQKAGRAALPLPPAMQTELKEFEAWFARTLT